MNIVWLVLKFVLALFLIYAGVQHFVNPDFFMKVIPPFLLSIGLPIVYISGVVEIGIGLMMLIRKYEVVGTTAFFLLMLLFLPLHIWDVFAESPFTGSKNAALIRLAIQVILIGVLWKMKVSLAAKSSSV